MTNDIEAIAARAEKATLNQPQPPPRPGTAPHTVDLLISLLVERKAMGVAKYGVAHQHDNGRDHLVDALQEAMDLSVYLMAEVRELRAKLDASYTEDEVRELIFNFCGQESKQVDEALYRIRAARKAGP